jgi:hypothetical protein
VFTVGGGGGNDKLGQPRWWETAMDEQSLVIHHSREFVVAKIHGEVQGYQENFGARRDASLVWVELSLVQSN